ncbi:MAG: glycerophosphodiester phosphodiesterase [Gammaproteobacteria bacterium]|nr:glycerophosphodiester phosphodiesterase [Gammaproteobacteria bacterium]
MMKKQWILPWVIGHRGACGYAPENTLASIGKAQALGLSWIEVDVMLTQDNELVIFHDESLARTTNGKGKVRDVTLAYIKSLDAGSWFGDTFSGEKVPTLDELLNYCRKLKMNVNLELKACEGDEEILVKKVLEALKNESQSSFLLSSFSMKTLYLLREKACPFRLAANFEGWVEGWERIAKHIAAYSLHYPYEALTQARVDRVHAAGCCVLAYTVNTPEESARLCALGVDALFSDVGDKVETCS